MCTVSLNTVQSASKSANNLRFSLLFMVKKISCSLIPAQSSSSRSEIGGILSPGAAGTAAGNWKASVVFGDADQLG